MTDRRTSSAPPCTAFGCRPKLGEPCEECGGRVELHEMSSVGRTHRVEYHGPICSHHPWNAKEQRT